ncbi:MAG: ATP-binding protein, partial [Deltaproteobacteria bacterium]
SNSKLLSREIATSLRGRTLTYEVFPLSFREYLEFNKVELDLYHTSTRAKIANLFEKFLLEGGFPEIAV